MTSARRLSLMLLCAISLAFDWGARLPRLERDLASGDADTRRAAVRALATLDAAQAGPVLLRALSDEDPAVRIEAARAVARLRLPEAGERLMSWLEDADPNQRRAAVAALGEIGDARAVGRLSRALGDSEPEVREEAVRALGRIGHDVPLSPISGLLEDSEPGVRREAARVLGELGNAGAVMALVGAVEDSSPQVRAAVVTSLGELGDALAVGALSGALSDDDAEVRMRAAMALGRLRDPRATRRLVELSRGSDVRLARASLASLSSLGSELAISALVAALTRPSLHRTAVLQLQALAAEGGVPDALLTRLARALDEAGDPRGAAAVIDALEVLLEQRPSDRPVPALLRALAQGRGPEERLLAALAASGSEGAAMPIFARLEDADEHTRVAALEATERYVARRPGDGRLADPLLHLLARASSGSGPLPAQGSTLRESSRTRRLRRVRLMNLLGAVGAARALPALMAATGAADAQERFAAVRAIGRLGVAQGAESLMPLLDDRDARVRFEAAQAIGASAGPAVVRRLLQDLKRPGAVDRHARLLALAGALGRSEPRLSLPGGLADGLRQSLLAFAHHADLRIASRALSVIGAWGDAELLAALAAEVPPGRGALARQWVWLLSASSGSAEGRAALDALDARDPLLAAAAAAGLGERRGREVVEPLLRAVRDLPFPVDASASFALARLGRRGVLRQRDAPALCALLTRRHPATRANVIIALASLQAPACPDGADPARLLASAQAPQIRAAAARWLQATGRQDAAAVLARHVQGEVDPRATRACRSPELPPLGRRADVYAYAADGETPLVDRLVALTLADSSVLVTPTDALAHLHLDDAPEGELSLWDPAVAPLEP